MRGRSCGAALFMSAIPTIRLVASQGDCHIRPMILSLAALLMAAASPAPSPVIDPARIAAHVAALASDAYEGRAPNTPGEARTIQYVIDQMAAAGLSPAAADGGWRQPVELVARTPDTARLSVGRQRTASSDLLLTGTRELETASGPLVFAGYADGAVSTDVEGAVVLYLAGQRPGAAGTPSVAERRAALRRSGAVAAIGLIADDDWQTASASLRQGGTGLAGEPELAIRGSMRAGAAVPLIAAGGGDLAQLIEAAEGEGFVPWRGNIQAELSAKTEVRPFTSWNVAGLLPGRIEPDKLIVVTAHWDHLGICRPVGAGDRICNGAVDNASGIGGMIEMARALAAGPRPDRSVLFLATTAEEMGLLGARAYTRAPLRPLADTVAALNLDTIALRPAGAPVALVGRRLSTIDSIVAAAAESQGRQMDATDGADAFVRRSDAFAFLNSGVPAIVATGVLAGDIEHDPLLAGFFRDRYHQPGDEAAAIADWSGAAEDVALNLAILRALTRSDVQVNWLPDSPWQRGQPR